MCSHVPILTEKLTLLDRKLGFVHEVSLVTSNVLITYPSHRLRPLGCRGAFEKDVGVGWVTIVTQQAENDSLAAICHS